jgi:hypothetical protein
MTYSRSVSSRAQTLGTERVCTESGENTGAGAVSKVVTDPLATVPPSASAEPARVGDGVEDTEFLKPHIGGSVCPSTSRSFSVPIQFKCVAVEKPSEFNTKRKEKKRGKRRSRTKRKTVEQGF